MRDPTAEALIRFIEEEIIPTNGCPEIIISDNGPQFRSKKYLEMCAKNKIQAYKTPYYHPQANQVEATNKSIKNSLLAYIDEDKNQTRWDEYLRRATDHLNRTPHTSTGVSPNYLHLGRELTLTGDEHTILNDANPDRDYSDDRYQVVMNEARAIQQHRYDDSRDTHNLRARKRNFQVGQEVWIPNKKQSKAGERYSAKLARPKIRAYVQSKDGEDTYTLIDGNGKTLGVYHSNDISTR